MNVVTQTGAVRRVVVSAINAEEFPLASGGLKQERDNVGLRIVPLSQFGGSARRIKITKGDHAPPVSFGIPSENLFEYQLCLSIGIHRLLRIILANRDSLRRTVNGGGRGEDKVPDIGGPQDLQHSD